MEAKVRSKLRAEWQRSGQVRDLQSAFRAKDLGQRGWLPVEAIEQVLAELGVVIGGAGAAHRAGHAAAATD